MWFKDDLPHLDTHDVVLWKGKNKKKSIQECNHSQMNSQPKVALKKIHFMHEKS
jgi:hypothetical protein